MFKPLLLPLLCSLFAIACQPGDDIEARTAELASTPGLRVTIRDAGELSPETVRAITHHLEGADKDHGAAIVRVEKVDDAAPIVQIELRGGALPPTGEVAGALKGEFPALAGATITAATIAAGEAPSAPLPVFTADDDLSPADAAQQIREQLAADGVDGEVDVEVEDGPDGRRVRVEVKKTETH